MSPSMPSSFILMHLLVLLSYDLRVKDRQVVLFIRLVILDAINLNRTGLDGTMQCAVWAFLSLLSLFFDVHLLVEGNSFDV